MKRTKPPMKVTRRYVRLPPIELPHTLDRAINDYKLWSDNYFQNVERRSKISKPQFHYTDLAGLDGILRSKQIWFTDYRHLNDQTELMYGINLAKSMLAARAKKEGLQGALSGWIDDLLTKRNFGKISFFVASFSQNPDDLYQWRSYADDARGVAIGFSPKLFQQNEELHKNPLKNTFAGPVRYVDALTRARHARGIDKASSILKDATFYAYRHLRDSTIGMEFLNQLARSVVAAPLIWNSLTCKHFGYEREAETRLVIMGQASKFSGKLSKRTRNKQAVPYIAYDLPLSVGGAITQIIIGPAASEGMEEEVKRMLGSAGVGYPVRISRSCIPYRSFRGP